LGRLVATNTTSPLTALLLILLREVSLGSADNVCKFSLVFAAYLLESNSSRSLLVNNSSQAGLALNDDVGYTHLAAKSRKEYDELNRIDVVSNDNKSGLLRFDESDDVVQAILHIERLLVLSVLILALGSGSGRGLETSLLLNLGLRTILVEQLEQLSGRVLVQSVRELGNGRGNLEALVKDDLLALKANVFRPLDEAC